ncbi:MAG: glycine oxidase ThiO [Pirellulales bacterium]|nr:glycine oxidase ThiO [Pirellulales bacterium]
MALFPDTLILGGGIIGLSLAYELAGRGQQVRVLDRGQIGREASWTGAGMLPACKFRTRAEPRDWLGGYSSQLHAEWAERLREETGIDNGYRQCGGIYLASDHATANELLSTCDGWRREGLNAKWLHASDLEKDEPALAGVYDRYPLTGAAFVAEESQIRNPRHLRALVAACQRLGVEVSPGVEVFDFETAGQRVAKVRTSAGDLESGSVVIAAGAWSAALAARLNVHLDIKPIRGQIALLDCGRSPLKRIVILGSHYLVPRDDGRVLVGSTQEDVGFERGETVGALIELMTFATRLSPAFKAAKLERSWHGFRPASATNWPYLGRLPNLSNGYIAAGHHRQGLWLSTGTAVIMSRLVRGEATGVDLSSFSPP